MSTAGLTRRTLLTAASVMPVAVGSSPIETGAAKPWDVALRRYIAARQRHETFLADVLDPAVAAAGSKGRGLTAHIAVLEEQENSLLSDRLDALENLVAVPVGDLAVLRIKFRLAYEEVLHHEDRAGLLATILADLERLSV